MFQLHSIPSSQGGIAGYRIGEDQSGGKETILPGPRTTAAKSGVHSSIGRYQKHWLARAEEARILANQMTDAEAKVAMLRIAEDYERLAQRAEGRALGRHKLAAPCMSGKEHCEG